MPWLLGTLVLAGTRLAATQVRIGDSVPFLVSCGRLDVRLLKPRFCRVLLNERDCSAFFIRLKPGDAGRNCLWQASTSGAAGNCTASLSKFSCEEEATSRPSLPDSPAVRAALKHRKRRLARLSIAQFGNPCHSQSSTDKSSGDARCEAWCSDALPANCKSCKCRGCASCYNLPLSATQVGVRASCAHLGGAACGNVTDDATPFLTTVQHFSPRLDYNQTRPQWIDDIFTRYSPERHLREVLNPRDPSVLTVAADYGLSKEELDALEKLAGAPSGSLSLAASGESS